MEFGLLGPNKGLGLVLQLHSQSVVERFNGQ